MLRLGFGIWGRTGSSDVKGDALRTEQTDQ